MNVNDFGVFINASIFGWMLTFINTENKPRNKEFDNMIWEKFDLGELFFGTISGGRQAMYDARAAAEERVLKAAKENGHESVGSYLHVLYTEAQSEV